MDNVGGDPTKVNDSTSDIKFDCYDNSHAFSIRCGKCADIHNAQLEGKTTVPCECDCHSYTWTSTSPTTLLYNDTTDGHIDFTGGSTFIDYNSINGTNKTINTSDNTLTIDDCQCSVHRKELCECGFHYVDENNYLCHKKRIRNAYKELSRKD